VVQLMNGLNHWMAFSKELSTACEQCSESRADFRWLLRTTCIASDGDGR
jgi:hypothetical protein